jgi:hypothetical protein
MGQPNTFLAKDRRRDLDGRGERRVAPEQAAEDAAARHGVGLGAATD